MDTKLTGLYIDKKNSYFGRHGGDVLFTVVPLLLIFSATILNTYQSMLKQARSNWATNKCNPLYMPFAGYIMPQPGQSAVKTTADNFDYCIHGNISSVIGIILMPLEFVNFLILSTLDMMVQSLVAALKLKAYLASLLKKSNKETTDHFGNFLAALSFMIIKIRDAMARTTATILTGIFTIYTVYNIMVSGLMNVTNIMVELLIIMSIAITVMLTTGSLLCASIVTFIPGMVLIILGMALLQLIFIPFLIIYILIQIFMDETFGAKAKPAPFVR